MKHWDWEKFKVEENGLRSERRREVMLRTSRTATGLDTTVGVKDVQICE